MIYFPKCARHQSHPRCARVPLLRGKIVSTLVWALSPHKSRKFLITVISVMEVYFLRPSVEVRYVWIIQYQKLNYKYCLSLSRVLSTFLICVMGGDATRIRGRKCECSSTHSPLLNPALCSWLSLSSSDINIVISDPFANHEYISMCLPPTLLNTMTITIVYFSYDVYGNVMHT
jgi:hypothetical protein